MSRKGNGYDNAVAESFFHTLKVECVNDEDYQTRSDGHVRRATKEAREVSKLSGGGSGLPATTIRHFPIPRFSLSFCDLPAIYSPR